MIYDGKNIRLHKQVPLGIILLAFCMCFGIHSYASSDHSKELDALDLKKLSSSSQVSEPIKNDLDGQLSHNQYVFKINAEGNVFVEGTGIGEGVFKVAHQYGKSQDGNEELSNIIIGPNGIISARKNDGQFKEIVIDPDTGEVMQSSPPYKLETLNELEHMLKGEPLASSSERGDSSPEESEEHLGAPIFSPDAEGGKPETAPATRVQSADLSPKPKRQFEGFNPGSQWSFREPIFGGSSANGSLGQKGPQIADPNYAAPRGSSGFSGFSRSSPSSSGSGSSSLGASNFAKPNLGTKDSGQPLAGYSSPHVRSGSSISSSPGGTPIDGVQPETRRITPGTASSAAIAQLSPAERAAINKYRNGMSYSSGTPRYRFKFPERIFDDVPVGGDGKFRFAYFDPRIKSQMESIASKHPLVEAVYYPVGSPEHSHAVTMSGGGAQITALGVDGAGRKYTRFTGSPVSSLSRFIASGGIGNDRELYHLENYNRAMNSLMAKMKERQAPRQTPLASNRSLGSKPNDVASTGTRLPSSHPPISGDREIRNMQEATALVSQKCMACHDGTRISDKKRGPRFPSYIQDWAEWEKRLDAKDPDALAWLAKFGKSVVHGSMVYNAGVGNSLLGSSLRTLLAKQLTTYLGSHEPKDNRIGSEYAPSSIMANQNKLPAYLDVLKKANISDPRKKDEILEFDAMWDHDGSPVWHWAAAAGDSGKRGAKALKMNPPASSPRGQLFEQDRNGNWIWKKPLGFGFSKDKNTQGLESFFMIRFPRDENGNLIKGVKGRDKETNADGVDARGVRSHRRVTDEEASLMGSFPEGTKVFEVLYSESLGERIPIDIISRQKTISPDGTVTWEVDSLRPDSSPEKVKEWVYQQPNWKTDPNYQKIIQAVNNPVQDNIVSNLGNGGSGGAPFIVDGRRTNTIRGSKSVLSGVSPEVLRKMYRELPMESALGSTGWQLEPSNMFRNSHRGIAINSNNCRNCHDQSGKRFENIFNEAGLSSGSVARYGNGPGYDSVLSAPWFSLAALRQYSNSQNKRAYDGMRPEWAKFFENYSPTRHPRRTYLRTESDSYSQHPLKSKPPRR